MKLKLFSAMTALLGFTSCMQMEPPQQVDFVTEVKPLLETRCLECHQHQYVCAGLNLETRKLAMKGGRTGAVIIPGSPHQSLLYKVLLLGHESPVAMPPTPDGVESEELQLLHDWIKQGANWPEGVRLVPPQEWKKSHT
ncbi:c-type cytochrome domain-containing protein [Prosthecobacter sp.]|jgi:hypothetical protein|uniref:c-type cytochrome domain-containing protein n=1 Tax=Prosthecobacter sp. TaxID=1965333 RepID=UPI0037C8329D